MPPDALLNAKNAARSMVFDPSQLVIQNGVAVQVIPVVKADLQAKITAFTNQISTLQKSLTTMQDIFDKLD